MTILPDDLLKLVLAIFVGGLIGAEREYHDKAAGFRTLIFICAGATLFTIFAAKMDPNNDPSRLAAGVISGVGFLGAGVILHDAGRVIGLTTAASIWLTAALGVGIAAGQYLFSLTATGIMLVVLWVFPRFEEWMDRGQDERTYEIVCALAPDKPEQLEASLRESGLHVRGRSSRQVKESDEMTCTWETRGSPRSHDQFVKRLFADAQVKEFRF